MTTITLIRPNLDDLPGYEHALAQGWSPDTVQDVSREQLERLRRERDEAAAASKKLQEEQASLLDDHNKLKNEYAKLQTEFNEWIELIEQS